MNDDLAKAADELTAAAEAGVSLDTGNTTPGGLPLPPEEGQNPTPNKLEIGSDGSASGVTAGVSDGLSVPMEAKPGEVDPNIAIGLEAKAAPAGGASGINGAGANGVGANGVGAGAQAEAEVAANAGVNAVKIAEANEMPTDEKAAEDKPKTGFAAFLEKAKKMDVKNLDIKALFAKGPNGEQDLVTGTATMFEVNLVPAVKTEMLKAMKLRNIVLFVAIIVVAIFGGGAMIMGSIAAGEKITISDQTARLDAMSDKINSFTGLSEYLTVQDQLGALASIDQEKKVLSRIFSFLAVMLPSAPDSVTLSELDINMQEGSLLFEGYANAGVAPFIDYRVLEAFKKSIGLVKYDYGVYVDANGEEIPERCIVETNDNGGVFAETTEFDDGSSMQSVYVYWLRSKTGCDATKTSLEEDLAELQSEIDLRADLAKDDPTTKAMTANEIRTQKQDIYEEYEGSLYQTWYDEWLEEQNLTRADDFASFTDEQLKSYQEALLKYINGLDDYESSLVQELIADGEDVRDLKVEKIWRTPRFSEWYHADRETVDADGNALPTIDLDGTISGVAHFESSECQSYSGTEIDGKVMWTTTNTCYLSEEEVDVLESSNGKDMDGDLVLRFQALVQINPDALLAANKHMLAIGPDGQNVTDSYLQVNNMFAQAAEDCSSSDTVCVENTQNAGGSSSSSSSSSSSRSSSSSSSSSSSNSSSSSRSVTDEDDEEEEE